MPLDFPRDPNSAFNHIMSEAIRQSVRRLVADLPDVARAIADGGERDLAGMLSGIGGWRITEGLKTAIACAVMKGMPPDGYDLAMVRQALLDYLRNR